ncbi:MAG: hypothetical protein IV090_25410 [Candidatus Sericytochromatia bacterium]|nr:hypothetical protein [Candidatus Sericytochromatia bacterium]
MVQRLSKAGRVLLVSVFLLLGCRQAPAPDETPPSGQSVEAIQSYTLVLQGYEDGEARRLFQTELEKLGLEVELLQSGANRAEYQITLGKESPTEWLKSLSQTFEKHYELKQDGSRLLFLRR